MEEQLLTVKNLAELLNISERTVYNMVEKSRIPYYRIGTQNGGEYRFNKEDVLNALSQHKGE